VGHNPLPLPTADEFPLPDCYCGRRGCVEAYLSGPAMAADHHRHTGELLSAVEIDGRASSGDTACEATLQRYEARLGRALASVINILDPDVIVLGAACRKCSGSTAICRYPAVNTFFRTFLKQNFCHLPTGTPPGFEALHGYGIDGKIRRP
jgi:predicted NBD/HSP70 family sugar kinase